MFVKIFSKKMFFSESVTEFGPRIPLQDMRDCTPRETSIVGISPNKKTPYNTHPTANKRPMLTFNSSPQMYSAEGIIITRLSREIQKKQSIFSAIDDEDDMSHSSTQNPFVGEIDGNSGEIQLDVSFPKSYYYLQIIHFRLLSISEVRIKNSKHDNILFQFIGPPLSVKNFASDYFCN